MTESGGSSPPPPPPPPPHQQPPALPYRMTISGRNQLAAEERFNALKRTGPLLYDSFINHSLYWGSLSVAWGELTGYNDEFETEQTIYYAGRSDGEYIPAKSHWVGSPGEFFAAKISLPKPRTQSTHMLSTLKENRNTKKVSMYKRMIHPGEVNRIRSFPQAPHLIATLSDSPTTFVWDTKTQPHRHENQLAADANNNNTHASAPTSSSQPAGKKSKQQQQQPQPPQRGGLAEFADPCPASLPDFRLEGHTSAADFALDTRGSRDVISAGSDRLVLLWDITAAPFKDNQLHPTCTFQGHFAPVEDCSFRPAHAEGVTGGTGGGGGVQLCSVGQDRELLVWDSRQGGARPTSRTSAIHSDDANCCAWSALEDRILTGGSDGVVNVFDCRQLASPMVQVKHKGSVINVRWSPHDADVFATSDESQFVSLFRLGGGGGGGGNEDEVELLLQHGTHRSTVVDFQFNPINPWVLASVSDDSSEDTKCGGGTLQTWRVNELVYKDAGADLEWAAHMEKLVRQQQQQQNGGASTTTTPAIDDD